MVPIFAARRPTDGLAFEDAIAATPTLAPVAHALRRYFTDVLVRGTSNGTRHPIDTGVVAAGESAVVRLRVGLAAGPTNDTTFSKSFIVGLPELEPLLFNILGRRLPASSFLSDEIRHLSRRARDTFDRITTNLMSQAALGSI